MAKTRSAAVAGLALCLAAISAQAGDAAPAAAKPASTAAAAGPGAASAESAALTQQAAAVGYKLHHRDGKVVYCRASQEIGTRIDTPSCITPDQVSAVVSRSQGNKDSVEDLQQRQMKQPGGDRPLPISLLSAKTSH